MNGTHYWEYKKCEERAGVSDEEPRLGLALVDIVTDKRNNGENTGQSGWKGPGILWIAAEPEEPPRKR